MSLEKKGLTQMINNNCNGVSISKHANKLLRHRIRIT